MKAGIPYEEYGFESLPCREENVSRRFSKDEVPHMDATIAPPESEIAGVLAGVQF